MSAILLLQIYCLKFVVLINNVPVIILSQVHCILKRYITVPTYCSYIITNAIKGIQNSVLVFKQAATSLVIVQYML